MKIIKKMKKDKDKKIAEQEKGNKKREIAVRVKNVSKNFKIPHKKIDSMRSAFVNIFQKKTYEEFKALEDVSFEVEKGEFFGIIGRNGAGKSTLLKILAGVYQSSAGEVEVNGMIAPFLELGIGFDPDLSGRDNIYLNATVLGLTKKEIDEKFDEIVEFSELRKFIDQQVKNYSTGMRSRLAFAVSIHANRGILLMDEVLAVGDSKFKEKCLNIFRSYKEKGKTVVLVTHDTGTVKKYCNRALLLDHGKIAKIGDVEEVCEEYKWRNMTEEEKKEFLEKKKIEKEKQEKKEKEEIFKRHLTAMAQKKEEGVKKMEKKKKIDSEKKEKPVEISSAEFLDREGKEKDSFETGEAIDIKINYKVNKEIDILNFGVGWHAVPGGQVFGYNTQMDDFKIEKDKNSILLHFDEFPVLKGDYSVNIACWGEDEKEHFDYKPKYKTIKIHSTGKKNNYRGFCYIKHEWKSM